MIYSCVLTEGNSKLKFHAMREDGTAACSSYIHVSRDGPASSVPRALRCRSSACHTLFAQADRLAHQDNKMDDTAMVTDYRPIYPSACKRGEENKSNIRRLWSDAFELCFEADFVPHNERIERALSKLRQTLADIGDPGFPEKPESDFWLDASRWRWFKNNCVRAYSLKAGGEHQYMVTSRFGRITGPTLNDAIDKAIREYWGDPEAAPPPSSPPAERDE